MRLSFLHTILLTLLLPACHFDTAAVALTQPGDKADQAPSCGTCRDTLATCVDAANDVGLCLDDHDVCAADQGCGEPCKTGGDLFVTCAATAGTAWQVENCLALLATFRGRYDACQFDRCDLCVEARQSCEAGGGSGCDGTYAGCAQGCEAPPEPTTCTQCREELEDCARDRLPTVTCQSQFDACVDLNPSAAGPCYGSAAKEACDVCRWQLQNCDGDANACGDEFQECKTQAGITEACMMGGSSSG